MTSHGVCLEQEAQSRCCRIFCCSQGGGEESEGSTTLLRSVFSSAHRSCTSVHSISKLIVHPAGDGLRSRFGRGLFYDFFTCPGSRARKKVVRSEWALVS